MVNDTRPQLIGKSDSQFPAFIQGAIKAYEQTPEKPLSVRIEPDPDCIEATFAQFRNQSSPILFKNYLQGTLLDNLTFDKVIEWAGDHYLNPSSKPKLLANAYRRQIDNLHPVSLKDYINNEVLTDAPPNQDIYRQFRNLRIDDELRSVLKLQRPKFITQGELKYPCLWIGKDGVNTHLHTDAADNFVIVCIGKKRFHLFPPSSLRYLSLKSMQRTSYLISPISPKNPDLVQYPDFEKAQCISIDVEAGDLLFMPLAWGHYVETIGNTYMYNYWMSNNVPAFYRR